MSERQKQLPTEEQNIINLLLEAKGYPIRLKVIAETLGIQDNTCNKLLKYLRDKGYNIKNRFVEANGKKKKYKEHWIDKNYMFKSSPKPKQKWKMFKTEHSKTCSSYWTRFGICTICGKER